MINYKCKKCKRWLQEVTIKKLDHHNIKTYVCCHCKRGYEIYQC